MRASGETARRRTTSVAGGVALCAALVLAVAGLVCAPAALALSHGAQECAACHNAENPDTVTLRSSMDEVSQALALELQERLKKAGVVVEEARIAHLAYAPEIAQTMLRRQQAEAVIAARQKIVHGAVSMVEMALKDLAGRGVLDGLQHFGLIDSTFAASDAGALK